MESFAGDAPRGLHPDPPPWRRMPQRRGPEGSALIATTHTHSFEALARHDAATCRFPPLRHYQGRRRVRLEARKEARA